MDKEGCCTSPSAFKTFVIFCKGFFYFRYSLNFLKEDFSFKVSLQPLFFSGAAIIFVSF